MCPPYTQSLPSAFKYIGSISLFLKLLNLSRPCALFLTWDGENNIYSVDFTGAS